MSTSTIRGLVNTYLDSVKLLAGSRAMLETDGVEWGAVVTGTPANVDILVDEGFDPAQLATFGANDLIMAVRAADPEAAFAQAEAAMFTSAGRSDAPDSGPEIRSLTELAGPGDAPNLAVVSVGGPFAALEAHKAITAHMDVLLFSDNVPLSDEIELKRRALDRSLYVMGPGAGTAVVGGVGLGFANQVRLGPVGVVAAAGTGAQEVMSLIDRAGLGVSQVIGVGGRDLSDAVGGHMTAHAISSLEHDPHTEAILLVSKPPSAAVSGRLLGRSFTKPVVAALIGLRETLDVGDGIRLAPDLESGVAAVLGALGHEFEPRVDGLAESIEASIAGLGDGRTTIRGLFSGGTMCFEAMTVMAEHGLQVYSNTPLAEGLDVDSAGTDSHICLDLGEEEYTRGRPHPMIDPAARLDLIAEVGAQPETAVVLIDVVLGYGSHDDPAGQLAPVCAEVMKVDGGPQVVAYVLGTDADPQGLAGQRRQLLDAGCIVAPTNARTALTATAIATRRPALSSFRRRSR